MKPIDFANFPSIWDESFFGLTEQDRALLKRAPTAGELQDLSTRRAFRFILSKAKERGGLAMVECFSFEMSRGLAPWVDRMSYYTGVVTALKYVLDMPRELYDAAQAAEVQSEEPEESPREEIFDGGSSNQPGDLNGAS